MSTIRERCKVLGITQKRLAELSGFSESAICNLVRSGHGSDALLQAVEVALTTAGHQVPPKVAPVDDDDDDDDTDEGVLDRIWRLLRDLDVPEVGDEADQVAWLLGQRGIRP